MKMLIITLLALSLAQQVDVREEMIKRMVLDHILELEQVQGPLDAKLICNTCKVAMKRIKSFSQNELTHFVMKEFELICPKIKDEQFCKGISQTFIEQFTSHYFNHIFDPQNGCASLGVCEYTYPVQTLEQYIHVVLNDQFTKEQQNEWVSQANAKTTNHDEFKVVHLADLHIDSEYAVGAKAICTDPFCCREENGAPDHPSEGAQYWGTHAPCDLPPRTIGNMIEFIGREIKPDFVIWTGDSTSHDVWHQQQHNQTQPTRWITEQIKTYLPDTQIYAIFGNHEAYPADQYDTNGEGSQWLRNEAVEMWQQYLDTQAQQSLKQRGFYSQVDQLRNLKVIAMNTQVCDSLNFFLFEKITDPNDELAWLQEQLHQSELNHEFAIIFAHIPPGDTFCHTQWAQRFAVVVERYQHVIKGLFYGHTHQDHVQHIKSMVDGRHLATAFIAPSGTTFSYQNPSFRVFDFDANNNVKDYTQYRLNLDKANAEGINATLDWHVAYTFLNEYGLKSARVEDVKEITNLLNQNERLLERYIFNFYGGSEKIFADKHKDLNNVLFRQSTRKYYICGSQTGVFEEWYQCVGTLEKFKDYNFLVFRLLDKLAGKWRDYEHGSQ